jgi:hypothetical protein
MNDDDVSVRAEAASAYLDDELDAAERASTSADPEAMALVESFTQLRQALGELAPVADEVRAAALSAALAQFDVRQNVLATAPARVTRLPTRWQRAYRVLGGAAAAAVIAVLLVAALNSAKGSDTKSSSTVGPDAAGSQRVEMPAGSAAMAPGATTAAAGTAALGAASTKMAAAALPAVNSSGDLAQYASSFAADSVAAPQAAAGASPAPTELVPVPALPPTSCLASTDTVLGPISVFGAPAWAVRDTSTGVVRAIDATDCHLLLRSPP